MLSPLTGAQFWGYVMLTLLTRAQFWVYVIIILLRAEQCPFGSSLAAKKRRFVGNSARRTTQCFYVYVLDSWQAMKVKLEIVPIKLFLPEIRESDTSNNLRFPGILATVIFSAK
jgi:hypothetical protein